MAQSVSSAEPEKLLRYSNFGMHVDHALDLEAMRLVPALQHFEATCTESGFQVGVGHLGDGLRGHARQSESVDSWVRQVGQGFQMADRGSFGTALWPGDVIRIKWPFPRWVAGVISLLPVLPALPGWIISLLPRLPWLRRNEVIVLPEPAPTPVPAPTPIPVPKEPAPQETPSDSAPEPVPIPRPTPTPGPSPERPAPQETPLEPPAPDLVKAGKPFDDVQTTATFPTYDDKERYLHNGVDIQPQPFDRGKTYPVHPIGPGKVFQVGQGVKKDDKGQPVLDEQGQPVLVGYGNYIIIEHELSDGSKVYTRYAHLASLPSLKEGTSVGLDTELGNMGQTGKASGPHVHLEVYRSAHPYNPQEGYGAHKATDLFSDDPALTWEQKMRDNFVDPLPIIDGTAGWQFKVPPEGPQPVSSGVSEART